MAVAPPKPVMLAQNAQSLKVGDVIYTELDTAKVHFGKICRMDKVVVDGIWSNKIEDIINVEINKYDSYPIAEREIVGQGLFHIENPLYQKWWVLKIKGVLAEKEEEKSPFNIEVVEI